MKSLGEYVRPLRAQDLVGPVEVQERDGDVPMLRLADRRKQRLPDRHRHAAFEDFLIEVRQHPRGLRATAGRRAPQEPALALRRRRRKTPGTFEIVPGLMTISPATAVPSISTTRVEPGPVTTSSRCDVPTRKKSKEPDVHSDRHPEVDLAAGCDELAHGLKAPAHPESRTGRASCVIRGSSPSNSRSGVATELEQAAALLIGNGQQLREAARDGGRHLLGAELAELGEFLRQHREPRDVGEDEGAVDRAVAQPRSSASHSSVRRGR